ncbi:MAG TPA: type II toxin-antitoxin system Phd/YefM family antitoxin [Armatimonadota bacterium]|nr:type II toxin-antitoxin system Phd/YefM family antitoxin [Armatimonadota bacterium]
MVKTPHIIPVSDLRQDAAGVIKRMRGSKEPVIVTQRGRAAAVMMSVEAYERTEHERELLRLLAKGEQDIEAGAGYTLAEVMAEADRLLADDQR